MDSWFETPGNLREAMYHPEEMTIHQLLSVMDTRKVDRGSIRIINHVDLVLLYMDSLQPLPQRTYKQNRHGSKLRQNQAEISSRLSIKCNSITGLPELRATSATPVKKLKRTSDLLDKEKEVGDGDRPAKIVKLNRDGLHAGTSGVERQQKSKSPSIKQKISWP